MKLIVACTCLTVVATTAAQQPTPPVFRSRVDVMTAEAFVLDASGRPIPDLTAEDFSATIDGHARKVVSAHFYGTEVEHKGPALDAAPTHASNVSTANGRSIVFVVDQESIRSGGGRLILNTASKLMESLAPSDAIGLLGLPGIKVELTRDHETVRAAFERLSGMRPQPVYNRGLSISFDEAIAITDRQDQRIFAAVRDRECPRVNNVNPNRINTCEVDLVNQARDLVMLSRAQVEKTLTALGSLVDQLKGVHGPKHIVLISGGIPYDEQSLTWYRAFERKATDAQIVLYSVHLDQPTIEGSDDLMGTSPFGGREMTQGLNALAGMTGGSFFSAVGPSEGVFRRIANELGNFYVLGIEPTAEDIAGTKHEIDVRVRRVGASVRARREAIIPIPTAVAPEQLTQEALHQPVDRGDVPIAVGTYIHRGDAPGKVKLLFSSEIGEGTTLRGPIEWAFVLGESNKVVTENHQRAGAPESGVIIASTNVIVPAGHYHLRVAAADSDGRVGSIEVPVVAELHGTGDIQAGDLVVGSARGNRMQPRAAIVRGTDLIAVSEIYGKNPEAFDGLDAELQLLSGNATEPIGSEHINLLATTDPTMRIAQPTLATTSFEPGNYVLKIVVRRAGRPVVAIARAFRIVPQAIPAPFDRLSRAR